jgi:uroporphyrinogen III methyltransferase/synthase
MAEKPLTGKQILITRARRQAGVLARRVEALGGGAIELPTIEIQAPTDFTAIDGALAGIENYHWLIFTSVNGVEPFLGRLEPSGKTAADLKHLQVAAIGSETAKRLEAKGISVALVPKRYQAEGILDCLDPGQLYGKRVLIPRAAKARDLLPETLRRWGAQVDVVEAYRTVAPALDVAAIKQQLLNGQVDVITFTSSSTVSNFVQLLGAGELTAVVGNAAIACIGPITAQTVVELGGKVAIMAQQFTIDGLVNAIVEYFGSARIISAAKGHSAPSSES